MNTSNRCLYNNSFACFFVEDNNTILGSLMNFESIIKQVPDMESDTIQLSLFE